MIELDKPFKLDKNGLWCLNSEEVDLIPFKFPEIGKSYYERPQFFKINGINDYIIKDTTMYPFFFNRIRTINLLMQLQEKQENITNIDFPIGYLKNRKEGIKGTIIPYYRKSTSLSNFIYRHKFSELKELYNHEENDIDNLIMLLLNILDLIHEMYQENMVYLDVRSPNFLFYKNDIKVIDFEPGYVYFTNNKIKYYYRIMKNYTMLVEEICKKLGFNNILINPEDTFADMENRVKVLKKELER